MQVKGGRCGYAYTKSLHSLFGKLKMINRIFIQSAYRIFISTSQLTKQNKMGECCAHVFNCNPYNSRNIFEQLSVSCSVIVDKTRFRRNKRSLLDDRSCFC